MSKAKQKSEVAKIIAEAAVEAAKDIDAQVEKKDDGRMGKLNADGGMLMAELVIQKREGGPDPLCVTVNEEIRWIKRNAKVIVPWYVVMVLKNNIERRFRQERDPQTGLNTVLWDDVPSEPFSYMPINPAPGVTL